MGPGHARAVAALHAATLGGLLTRLGAIALDAYYEACARSPFSTAFVAVDAGRVIGFVSGATSPRALRRDVLRRRPLSFTAGAVVGGIRRPSAVIDLVRSVFRAAPAHDSEAAELIYLAVDRSQRGRGTGEALVRRFSDEMRAAGIRRYELSVEAHNSDARRFYERLGFTCVAEFEEFGAPRARYSFEVPGSAP